MTAKLTEYGMAASMSRKGNCWDNAPTESFFNSLKNERVHGTTYATRADAQADLFEYIEVFYNRSRRHSTLGYSSPVRFLENWISEHAAQQPMAAQARPAGRRSSTGTSSMTTPILARVRDALQSCVQ
jgi:transposase InsO family protein